MSKLIELIVFPLGENRFLGIDQRCSHLALQEW